MAFVTVVTAFCATAALAAPGLTVTNLRCEYLTNPRGIDVRQPRLSWMLQAEARQQGQTACQVLAASSPVILGKNQGDLWDSGKVLSAEPIHFIYQGQALRSRMAVYWKVRVWDRNGQASRWSAPASWTMGLLEPRDWQAQWIADSASAARTATLRPHNGYHSAFANQAEATKWIVLDLGRAQRFDAIRLFPARPYDWQPDTPGFLFPARFRVEAAETANFAEGRVLVDRTQAEEPNPGTNAPLYRFAPLTARFLRLAVTQLRQRETTNFGLALAEWQVLEQGRNLAKGAQVSALDSIETGGWSKSNLVDDVVHAVPPGGKKEALPATLLRKTFALQHPIVRATAYASALGLYELRLNGLRAGEQLLAPEWTSYRRRAQYQTYDVTPLLQRGLNVIRAELGEGWYAGRLMAMDRFPYGSYPRFLLQLEIEMIHGIQQVIVTDESWRGTTDGPIRSSGIYDGEVYDARREYPGLDRPDFEDRSWDSVKIFPLGAPALTAQCYEPIRVTQDLGPTALTRPKPGVFIFDFGRNMVGWCRLQVSGQAGRPITLRHAEMLNEDGTLYTANLRGAPQVDQFIPKTGGAITFEPRFTYHGFRFLELTGLAQAPSTNSVVGRVFHTAAPAVGRFECSDESLNQLYQNIVWTQRGNLMSTPNDCPQRDERFGWMGDIQAFAQTAIFNMDLAAFFTKFARDMRDDQADDGRFPDFAPHPGNPNLQFSGAPAWADAGVIVPWRAYVNYGDRRLLEAHFEAARRWVDYVHRHNPGLIWATNRFNDYNDWLNGDWIRQKDWPLKGGSVPKEVFATAFFAHSTELVGKMAHVLGRASEASHYRQLARQIKEAFQAQFVKEDGRIEGDTQAGYALALHFDLLPEPLRPRAAQYLVEGIGQYHNHLSTGIQSTHRAMLELARWGHVEVAWQLLTNRTFPSWLYMLDNGATTIWERWDGYVKGRGFQDAGMNSFNHWAFGAVGEWMWRHIVGLNPDETQPAWKHFVVRPRPGGGITWAKGEYDSIRGRVAVDWKVENDRFALRLTVPPGSQATVWMPAPGADRVLESGQPAAQAAGVQFLRQTEGCALFTVQSGSYEFETASSLRPF